MSAPLPKIAIQKAHRTVLARQPEGVIPWPMEPGSANPELQALALKSKKRPKVRFPKRPVVFVSDAHADANAFVDSLIAAGTVNCDKKGRLKLTRAGRRQEIIIGGDCLDKGPSNLSLLREIGQLYRQKARITLLAGNHDLRLLMGLLSRKQKTSVGSQHLFVRMGKKVIPLFREVFDQYLAGKGWDKKVPSEAKCRAALFPSDEWFDEFEFFAAGHLTVEGIEREVGKMRSKVDKFERHCHDHGMTLRQVYAAARQCERLFLHKKGEFRWFYERMELMAKRGSFLFLHAGLDDDMARLVYKKGINHANKAFHRSLRYQDLFSFYYSPQANTFRTKYRPADLPLTDLGVRWMRKAGIQVLVQGHVSRSHGQRLAVKHGVLHIEADITLDCNSRALEGLEGRGMGATVIAAKRGVLGLSCDYPQAKWLSPKHLKQICGALA